MKRVILACIAASALVPLTAEGTALAQGAAVQDTGQSAGSSQIAASSATSAQVKPSNENISVRINSPGNDGDVTQINSSAAASAAGNANQTTQTAAQAGAAQQAIGQDAHNAQAALSKAKSVQIAPSNENISVRIHSPGDSGDVKQVNASSAHSAAGNENATTQAAEQSGSGGGAPVAPSKSEPEERAKTTAPPPKSEPCAPACGGGKPTVQAIGQDASNKQVAASKAISLQEHPLNANHGDGGGSVTQINHSTAKSAAGNVNWTDQRAEQSAGHSAPDMVAKCKCGHTGTLVQAIGQSVKNKQVALSEAVSLQFHPVNLNAPVVHPGKPGSYPPSKGKEPEKKPYEKKPYEKKPYEKPTHEAPAPKPAGDVWQLNTSGAFSAAGNENGTSQTAFQFGGRWPLMI